MRISYIELKGIQTLIHTRQGPANPGVVSSSPPLFPLPNVSPPSPGPLPRPPALVMPMPMPSPQAGYMPSLTMQHALSVPDDSSATLMLNAPNNRPSPPAFPPRPHSDEPRMSAGKPGGTNSLNPSPERPQRLDVEVTAFGRPRAESSPPTPIVSTAGSAAGKNGANDKTQCSGMTKKGERCTRQVKAPPPLSILDPDTRFPRFCFQHTKEVLEPSGFHSRKGGRDNWVTFAGVFYGFTGV